LTVLNMGFESFGFEVLDLLVSAPPYEALLALTPLNISKWCVVVRMWSILDLGFIYYNDMIKIQDNKWFFAKQKLLHRTILLILQFLAIIMFSPKAVLRNIS
jgi:hypothetical protein